MSTIANYARALDFIAAAFSSDTVTVSNTSLTDDLFDSLLQMIIMGGHIARSPIIIYTTHAPSVDNQSSFNRLITTALAFDIRVSIYLQPAIYMCTVYRHHS